MVIDPGNLNKKIEIIEYFLTKDEDGFERKEEKLVLKTWAQVTNTSGTELLRGGSDFSEVKTRFLIRTPKITLDKDMVVKFKGQIYGIIYINDYNYDQKYTELMARLVIK